VALSDEQNAMLRLLASGEQGYDDIAALMGLSVDEVRAKVVGALAQLQAEGKPVPDVPPPLPGGAQPAAEVVPPEPDPVPEPPKVEEPPAEPVIAETVAPKVEPKPNKSVSATPPSSGGRTITLPTGRKAWMLGGGIVAAIVVIVVVILLVSGGGSGKDNSSTAATGEGGKTENASSESGKKPTYAELKAVDGSEAEGVATFGRYKKKLALAIEAKGLEGTTKGVDAYTVWLAQSPKKMLPLISIQVAGSGKRAGIIAGEYEVPIELLVYLANGTFDQIEITRTQTEKFEAGVEKATEEKKTPEYVGEPVLRGTITGPIVGIAKREEEEQKEGE
jgi:hypothetical protein